MHYLLQNTIKKQKNFLLTIVKPWLKNVLPSLSNAIGDRIIVTRTARQLLLGHQIPIFRHIKNLIKPLNMFGISWSANINLSNFNFGFGPHMSGQYSHLNEHYIQTENGHLFDGVYKIKGKRYFFFGAGHWSFYYTNMIFISEILPVLKLLVVQLMEVLVHFLESIFQSPIQMKLTFSTIKYVGVLNLLKTTACIIIIDY